MRDWDRITAEDIIQLCGQEYYDEMVGCESDDE